MRPGASCSSCGARRLRAHAGHGPPPARLPRRGRPAAGARRAGPPCCRRRRAGAGGGDGRADCYLRAKRLRPLPKHAEVIFLQKGFAVKKRRGGGTRPKASPAAACRQVPIPSPGSASARMLCSPRDYLVHSQVLGMLSQENTHIKSKPGSFQP